MWGNFDLVQERLSHYSFRPEAKYKIDRGLPLLEQRLEQKVKQYWADTSISSAEKLKGFDMDLSKFDPRNTTNMELREIRIALQELGIVDEFTGGWFGRTDLEFNSQGDEINKHKKVDLIKDFEHHLAFYKRELSAGQTLVKDSQTCMYTAISVLQALLEYSQKPRVNFLIDTKA